MNHATSELAIGSKLGMDATNKLPGEAFKRAWPPLIRSRMSDDVRRNIGSISAAAADFDSQLSVGRKLGIDAAKKIPGEGFKRPWPPLIKMDAAVKAKMGKTFWRNAMTKRSVRTLKKHFKSASRCERQLCARRP